eukprot:PhF_6_TR42016/c0_g1_i1/m.63523
MSTDKIKVTSVPPESFSTGTSLVRTPVEFQFSNSKTVVKTTTTTKPILAPHHAKEDSQPSNETANHQQYLVIVETVTSTVTECVPVLRKKSASVSRKPPSNKLTCVSKSIDITSPSNTSCSHRQYPAGFGLKVNSSRSCSAQSKRWK